jgi:hypothetical protein
MSSRAFLGAFPILGCLLLGVIAAPSRGQDSVEATAPRLSGAQWERLIRRDLRISFTRTTRDQALEVLSRPGQSERVRAVALLAIGCGGVPTERDRLESWIFEGTFAERQAALLAMGELGVAETQAVIRLARGMSPQLAGCAQLALLRSDSRVGRELVGSIAGDPDHPLQAVAADLLVFAEDIKASRESVPGRLLLELRWDAARRYGLIDLRSWTMRLVEDLVRDQRFVDHLVYSAAARLSMRGVRDHMLEVLLEGGEAVRLRGVVSAMPAELDQLVAAGIWAPKDDREWAQLIFEIDARRLEGLTDTILRHARVVPGLSAYASTLLVRGGNREGMGLLELDLSSPVAAERARIAETMGGTGEQRFIEILTPLLTDPEAEVRASALIAHFRLGDSAARAALRGALDQADSADKPEMIEGLCRVAREPKPRALLREFAGGLEGESRLSAAIALARFGDLDERERVREHLRNSAPGVSIRPEAVEVLVDSAAAEDRLLLAGLFPLEDDYDVNVALGLALTDLKEARILEVLRAALWREPWNRSVLAGGLIMHVGGIEVLRMELRKPPKNVTARDLRRVGFALGEWGGVDEIERLSRRRSAADPAVQGAFLGALGARTH